MPGRAPHSAAQCASRSRCDAGESASVARLVAVGHRVRTRATKHAQAAGVLFLSHRFRFASRAFAYPFASRSVQVAMDMRTAFSGRVAFALAIWPNRTRPIRRSISARAQVQVLASRGSFAQWFMKVAALTADGARRWGTGGADV